jgi:anti-sigma B factor antagonist
VANPFTLNVLTKDGLSLISLEGYLDAHTAPKFEAAIQSELDEKRSSIIVDCSKLTYISSAGLGVFMTFIEEVREIGGDIKLCGLVPKVRHTFEILGFQDIFELLDDVPAAVASFASKGAAEGA